MDEFITAEEMLDGRSLLCVTCENRYAAARTAKTLPAGTWKAGTRPRDHYVKNEDGKALCGRGGF